MLSIAISSWADASRPFGDFTRPVWLGEELAVLGHEVSHFCPGPPILENSRVEYVRVPGPALRPPPESADRQFHPLLNLVRTSPQRVGPFLKLLEISPDLLYVHGTINLGFFLARAAHVFPTIVDAHGSVATD